MADDYSEQTGQPDDANDDGARRRMMEFILRSALKPSLPPRQGSDASPGDNAALISRAGGMSSEVQPGTRPNIPPPRTTNEEAPTFPPTTNGGTSNMPLLGRGSAPVRPNVQPMRSDFPEKKLPGWEKALAIGAAPFVPGVSAAILTSPRRGAERQYEGAVQDWERQQGDEERAARIENLRSEARARDAKPQPETKPEIEVFNDLLKQGKTPQQAWEAMKTVGKEDKTPSFEEQTYQEWLQTHPKGTRLQFEKDKAAATQRPEQPQRPQRMMGVTPDGKVMEITPGMTLPPGTKSLGGELTLTAKTEQGEEAGKAATAYANDYLSGKQWTGPGDEALMEKFFEMAKPSSGFRMTQPQIEMLQRSRDWMGSLTAKAKHAFTPEAPWFSDTQRKQIVKTMNDLAQSRQQVKPGGGGATAPTGGGKTWNPRTGRYE